VRTSRLKKTFNEVANMLTLHFSPLKADYVEALRAFYLRDQRFRLLAAACLLVGLVSLFGLLNYGFTFFYALGLALLPLFLLYGLLWVPYNFGRQVDQNPVYRQETTWELSAAELVMTNASGETRFAWSDYHRIVETRLTYLLFLSAQKRLFNMLPKHAFANPAQEAEFRRLVEAHLPGLRQ
jgi:hypothetical protein